MNINLSESLNIIYPYLCNNLITLDDFNKIVSIARFLPITVGNTCILEIRLTKPESRVDFSICINKTDLAKELLSGKIALMKLNFLSPESNWKIIQKFVNTWINKKKPFHKIVSNIWLEFDVFDYYSFPPVPSIFLGINKVYTTRSKMIESDFVNSQYSILELIINYFFQGLIDKSILDNLRNCIYFLPHNAHIFQLGIMLGRNSSSIRICIKGIPLDKLICYLKKIGLNMNFNRLANILFLFSDLIDSLTLDLDIGSTISRQFGLECSFKDQPAKDERWEIILDRLIEVQLSSKEKKDSICSWPGYSYELVENNLLLKFLKTFCATDRILTIRAISHLKIVLNDHLKPEAKVYLVFGFGEQWNKFINSNQKNNLID